jgi:hypothetical protein
MASSTPASTSTITFIGGSLAMLVSKHLEGKDEYIKMEGTVRKNSINVQNV